MKRAIIIQGPTAVGKTAISIAVAKQLGTAILSADSRQCYREMNIGTAKPSPDELSEVRHHFIDEFSISTALTAADYEKIGLSHLEEIFTSHDSAVVCGGTGLYIKALCGGIDIMPPINDLVLAEVNDTYQKLGIAWLQQAVATEDPEFYREGEIHNPARLLRALVFMRSTRESIVHFRTFTPKQRPFQVIKIGLELPRELLYERINQRVDEMIAHGLEEEVRSLFPFKHLKNLNTVGYAELFAYMQGELTLKEAINKIKQNSRNYAKRQTTWFRKDEEIIWFRADDYDVVNKILALSTA